MDFEIRFSNFFRVHTDGTVARNDYYETRRYKMDKVKIYSAINAVRNRNFHEKSRFARSKNN